MSESYLGCDCGGEHYKLGQRAWCLDCSEYCYPDNPCEIAGLRSEVERLRTSLAGVMAIIDSNQTHWDKVVGGTDNPALIAARSVLLEIHE